MNRSHYTFINYVKLLACFSVIAVHFRLNLQWAIPEQAFGLKSQVIFASVYQLFIVCVPLFMITTGFLMLYKSFNKPYWSQFAKIVLLYVCCSIFSYLILFIISGTSSSIFDIIENILNFNLIGYSWYVEMYLGFLLIIPILNKVAINSSKKELQLYIIALITAISLPTFINTLPVISEYIHLPQYWKIIYPIIYYFIGAYFRQFGFPKINKFLSFLLLFIIIILSIGLSVISADPYVGGAEGGYGSLLIVIQSTLVFMLIDKIFTKDNKFVSFIAKLTLPIYLMSFVPDQLLYPYFIKFFGTAKQVIPHFIWLIPLIFFISISLATMINAFNNFLYKMLTKNA